ncbi:PREDICTED: histone H1oo [Condylura cristata]|uniref:histone H1oo n=1 Tax=Condylura cristata TaxID=143302 RepID=UPI000643B6F1|nr:PREDICTED: histone H1oo [Condylura cristata]
MALGGGSSTFSSETTTSSASSLPSTSAAGSSGSDGPEKPGPSHTVVRRIRRHPPVLNMVLEALRAGEQRRGTSVAAIKGFILHKYPAVDVIRLKYLLKQALATGVNRGLLTRPANSKAKGATGSFKLVPKHKRKTQSRKTSTKTVPRNAGAAKEQDPKKPSKAKKVPLNPGQAKREARKPGEGRAAHPKAGAAKETPKESSKAKKDPPCPGQVKRGPKKPAEGRTTAARKPGVGKERAPQKGGRSKDQEARLGKAPSTPQQPHKAAEAPRAGKAKTTGRSPQGAQPSSKTEAKSRGSKPTVTKIKNGTASPAKKMSAPPKAAARGAGVASKTKTAAASQGGGPHTRLSPLARKTVVPKGLRRSGVPTRAASLKVAGRKAGAQS